MIDRTFLANLFQERKSQSTIEWDIEKALFGSSCSQDENAKDLSLAETDSLLAKTMNQLSMEERNNALHDLHGVADVPEETPEFVKQQLEELQEALVGIKSKKAYYIAKSISPNYVTNRKLRLQFLRTENYNPKDAATRIVRYFESKMEIFGKEKLTKDILLSDLPKQDLEDFKKGYVHLLPNRDRSGRAIFCTIGSITTAIPLETRIRILWYLFLSAAEEEETQMRGVILIYYGVGQRRFFLDRASRIVSLLKSMPVRISAIHGCYDHPLLHPLLAMASFVMERTTLCRLRYHYGAHFECIYKLMAFGIPKEILPFDSEGQVDTTNLLHWLDTRLKQEATTPLSKRAVVPNNFDVLLGREKRILESPGNFRFRQLVDDYRDQYESVSKFEKTIVAESILKEIKDSGGRFLKQVELGWIEVGDVMARKKISHAFRNLRSSSTSASLSTFKRRTASLVLTGSGGVEL